MGIGLSTQSLNKVVQEWKNMVGEIQLLSR
jgi:hypothetical protein